MSAPTCIVVKNQLCELERVSRAVAEFGARRALPAPVTFAGKLAVDEILTNVISYGYDDADEHQIVVRLDVTGGMLTVVVEDDGRPFNPLEAAPADVEAPLEDRRLGGLGIHLVRKVMDELAYRREPGKNVVVMKKSIAAK
jgi:serine/threonine-protein kinase RsbW